MAVREAAFVFGAGDIFMIPFSLLWGGLVLFSLGPTFTHPAAGNSAIGSIVLCFFAVVAVYIIAGRFFVDMYLRSQTTYELLGESAIIRRTGLFANTTEVYLPSVGSINLDLSADGSGTIYFGPVRTLGTAPAGLATDRTRRRSS